MSAKERTARMRAKKDCFVRACSSNFHDNNDEDLKVIDVSPIKSLFCNLNLNNDGTRDESTLVKRRPNDSEFLDLDAKFGKGGIGEVKTLNSIEPTILDFKRPNAIGSNPCSWRPFYKHLEVYGRRGMTSFSEISAPPTIPG